MNYYVISFESVRGGEEGPPWFGRKIVQAESVLEAQNKFIAWLQEQPEYINGIFRFFFSVDEATNNFIQ
jgi:hypothetical protein